MIPALIDIGGPFKVLPAGVHPATMDEIRNQFAISDHRRKLFGGLQKAVAALSAAGCRLILLDGSFVTDKSHPKDYDVCWNPADVDIKKIDPVFFDFSNHRQAQKLRFGGEFLPILAKANDKDFFSQFFQTDRFTGKPKGILSIIL